MAKKKDLIVKKRRTTVPRAAAGRPQPVEPPQQPLEPAAPEETPALQEVPRKKRRRRSFFARVMLRLLIVAVVFVAGVWVYRNWDTLAPESLVIWLDEKFSGGEKGAGFPVDIVGSEITAMTRLKNNLAVLSDNALILYNSRGGEVDRRIHGYAKPILRSAGDYLLIAEADGLRFRLESRSGTLLDVPANNEKTEDGKTTTVLDKPLENKIVTASVDARGNVTLVTGSSQSHMSEVLVYNKQGKRLYARRSAEHMVVDAAVSPDGKQVAMVSLSTDGGAMRSSLQVFDMSSAENAPIKEYAQNDLMLCRVIYFDGGTVLAVGDSACWVVNPSGTLFEKQSYPEYELIGMTEGENSAALVLRRYGNTDGGRLLVVRSTGDVAYTADFEGSFRDISPAGSEGYWLLTGGELLHAGGKGWDQRLDIPADGRMVCGLGDRAIVLGLTSLTEYRP